MKKFLAISALAATPFFASMSFAQPGCGLGAQVFEGESGAVSHILAATTNGTFGNQTLGMTFGTLGCDTSEPVELSAVYINNNMDRVAADMAAGQGESLDALANLLKIEQADRARFQALVKANFDVIYSSSRATADEVYSSLNKLMAEDSVLAKYAA